MLSSASHLSRTRLDTTFDRASMLRAKGAKARRNTVASLMLTSLVDAFSILVIFLIMNHSANQEVVNVGGVNLPKASESQLIQEGVVVRIENGQFNVEDQVVAQGQLIARLKQLNSSASVAKKEGLIIVADRNMDYSDLSPVILAGSQAGFTKFKFAVIQK